MKAFVAETKNGFEVPVTSHGVTHFNEDSRLLSLVQEVLQGYEVEGDAVRFEVDMGRVVGITDLIETKDDDSVFYAKRLNRDVYTRLVCKKSPETTHYITLDLRKSDATSYEIYTAYIGRLVPSFPKGKNDPSQSSRKFWSNHALVFRNQDILLMGQKCMSVLGRVCFFVIVSRCMKIVTLSFLRKIGDFVEVKESLRFGEGDFYNVYHHVVADTGLQNDGFLGRFFAFRVTLIQNSAVKIEVLYPPIDKIKLKVGEFKEVSFGEYGAYTLKVEKIE